jgi:putative protease
MNKIELLAPAGSMESLIAAVNAGANAIYLGGKQFGARRSASNFDDQALVEAIRYCHRRGVSVFVTVNTLIKTDEMQDALNFVAYLYRHDVDAVIIQDLGLYEEIKNRFPDLPCHASTQMTLHSQRDVEFAASIGFERMVLSRELTYGEIEGIRSNTDVMLEIFAHGALCVSYSGQCLFSSHIGGRSGNRGACAQPCRKPYRLETVSGERVSDQTQVYLISPKDLKTYEHINELKQLAPISLKIEGRMKSPDYVFAVVRAYRNAIDGHQLIEDINALDKAFNRGYTKGHLFEESFSDFTNTALPSHQGTLLGKVISYKSGFVTLRLMDDLRMGDEMQVRHLGKTSGGRVEKLYKGTDHINEAQKGDTVIVNYKQPLKPHTIVFKTFDTAYIDYIKESRLTAYAPYGVSFYFEGKIGTCVTLRAVDENGNEVILTSEKCVEKANNKPLAEDRLIEQLGKLGGTLYYLSKIEIDFDVEATIPISIVNQLRRDVIEKLTEMRENWHHRRLDEEHSQKTTLILEENKEDKDQKGTSYQKKRSTYDCHVYDESQLTKVLQLNKDHRIFYHDLTAYANHMALYCQEQIIPAFPTIIRNDAWPFYEAFLERYVTHCLEQGLKPTLAINHVAHSSLKNKYPELLLIYDMGCLVFNQSSLDRLSDDHCDTVVLSPEMNIEEIEKLSLKHFNVSYPVFGHLPLMKMAYCPVGGTITGENKCGKCHSTSFVLIDTFENRFPLWCQPHTCHTMVLTPKPVNELNYAKRLLAHGVNHLRFDLRGLTEEQLTLVIDYLKGNIDKLPFASNHHESGYLKKGIE